jgi:hypothetical protein
MNMENWITFEGFWKNSKIKVGSGKQHEYCVSHKGKHEID